MRNITTIVIILCLGVADRAVCQTETGSTIATQYTISVPVGNTSKFVSKVSLRGVTVDYRYHFNDVASVGASVGWYAFYDKQEDGSYTVRNETMTLSGTQYRYINSLPILATFNYFLRGDNVLPFGGLGIGTTYNEARLVMGMYGVDIDTWHFTLAPEVGVRVKPRSKVSGYFTARYNVNLETEDLDTQSYIGLNVGVMWKL